MSERRSVSWWRNWITGASVQLISTVADAGSSVTFYVLSAAATYQHAGPPAHNQSTKHRQEHTIPPLIVGHRHAAGDIGSVRQRDWKSLLTPSPQPSTSVPSGYREPSLDVALCTQLSSAEVASQVILQDNIALNSRLAILTIMGVTEPHIVKLFSTESCSSLLKTAATMCWLHVWQLALGKSTHADPSTWLSYSAIKGRMQIGCVAGNVCEPSMSTSFQPVTLIATSLKR